MVRQFYLKNEKGQKYDLMDREKYCFLYEPSGLVFDILKVVQKIRKF